MASEEALAHKIARSVLNRPGESDLHEFETLKKLVTKYPSIASSKSFQVEYNHTIHVEFPLFAFATKRVGANWTQHMELLQLFYHAYPEAIQHTTSYGYLPLHAACDNGLDPRIILYFFEQYPEAASVKHCKGGWTPLAYYIMGSQPLEEVVKALIDAAPTCIEHEYANAVGSDGRITALPTPLVLAFCKNCNDSILSLLVPTTPESLCLMLDYEAEHEELVGSITSERAEMIATRVSPWIRSLRLNTKWFNRNGLAAFFSKLSESTLSSLEVFEMNVTSKVFADVNVTNAFSNLIRQSPNLQALFIKRPKDDTGPSNDDSFLSSLARALKGNEKLSRVFLGGLGGSFASLSEIMASCSDLKSVTVSNMEFTRDAVDSLVHGIRESSKLEHVFIHFCTMPTGGMNRVLEAIATSCPTINALQLAISQADGLPALSQLTNLEYLSIVMDPNYGNLYDRGPTKSILNLLETSTNLTRLDTRSFALPASDLSDILKQNNTLNILNIRDCANANAMVEGIVEALRESNASLLDVEVESVVEPISDELRQQLQYYTALNCVGRSQLIKAETANVSDLVQILIHLSEMDAQGQDRMKYIAALLRYGILRESPSLWSGHYNNEHQAPMLVETQDETTALMQSVLQGMHGLGLQEGRGGKSWRGRNQY